MLPSLLAASISEPARRHACARRYCRQNARALRTGWKFVGAARDCTQRHLQAAHVAVHCALHQQRVALVVSGVGTHTRSKRLSQLLVMAEPAQATTVTARNQIMEMSAQQRRRTAHLAALKASSVACVAKSCEAADPTLVLLPARCIGGLLPPACGSACGGGASLLRKRGGLETSPDAGADSEDLGTSWAAPAACRSLLFLRCFLEALAASSGS